MLKNAFDSLTWGNTFIRQRMYTMAMSNQGKYQLNEKDIDSVLNFLKLTDPEHATPEMAIALLEHMQAKFHMMNDQDPETLKKIYEDLQREIANKKN